MLIARTDRAGSRCVRRRPLLGQQARTAAPLGDGPDRQHLMAAEVRDVVGDPLAQMGVKQTFIYQRRDGGAVAERS